MDIPQDLRSARHAALGDPVRLGIVDELTVSDCSPTDLRATFGLESNLLAHHLSALENVGLIYRSTSSGDARRRYVHLNRKALNGLAFGGPAPSQCLPYGPALFLCTRNSARSQLAAALWRKLSGSIAESAGTDPAQAIDPRAVAAAKRIGLVLKATTPRDLSKLKMKPALVITVCDLVHEDLLQKDLGDQQQDLKTARWLHWSVADPVRRGTPQAFDSAVAELTERVSAVLESVGKAT